MAVYVVLVIGIMGTGVSALFAYSSGPPDGRTGSPADSLQTCNDTGCHNNYTLNSGLAAFSISAPGSYTPGEILSVSVSFGNSSTAKHGFELSALDTDNNHVGTFSSVEGDANTQTSNGDYIKHTSAGTANSSWSVQWTAPSSGATDPVTFYAAGNEANGDSTNQGDYIYTTTAQSSTVAATPTTTPTATPAATPTTSACEPDFITLDTKRLNLKLGESKTVTATVTGSSDCRPEGVAVNAVVKTGKNRVAIDTTTATTDANGQAIFTITAGQKKGNAKTVFTVEDSEGEVYKTFVIVKIRKK
jgi:hypothetical protein